VTHSRPVRRFAIGIALAAVLTTSAMSGCSAPAAQESPTASQPGGPTSSAGSAAAPGTAAPTAPATDAPVVVEELGRGEQEASVDVEVAGPTQVAFRRITLKPGAGTGLHCHDGQLIAVVEQGTLTHYAPIYPGGVHVYQAGDSIIEGPGYVHEGKNEGSENVVLLVTYVIPDGDPLAETDLTHCDPQ